MQQMSLILKINNKKNRIIAQFVEKNKHEEIINKIAFFVIIYVLYWFKLKLFSIEIILLSFKILPLQFSIDNTFILCQKRGKNRKIMQKMCLKAFPV